MSPHGIDRSGLLAKCLFALSLGLILSGCGKEDTLGQGLSLSVSPEKPYLVENAGPSCSDAVEAKALGERPAESVSSWRLTYPTFKLTWEPTTTLKVTEVRVTIKHSSIAEGEFSATLGSSEIEALLASPYAELTGPVMINSASVVERPASSAFATCGLSIGGIALAKDRNETSPFVATVTIEVRGSAKDADGNEAPVRKTLKAFAQFL